MQKLNKLFLTLVIFFLYSFNSLADDNLFYIDLDYIIKNSNSGRTMIAKLDNINKKNIEKFKFKKNELIEIEKDLKKKKNIISDDEIKKKLNILNTKLDEFKKYKKKTNEEFRIKKNNELSNIFKVINPIIQTYMDEKSINILMDKKNIFIGKTEYDITNNILDILNK
jgi:outer membrane protein